MKLVEHYKQTSQGVCELVSTSKEDTHISPQTNHKQKIQTELDKIQTKLDKATTLKELKAILATIITKFVEH